MNIVKIDRTLQYILLVAGQEDEFFDRELSPIHLLKYLYLADLAYAEQHDGETFSGIQWQFHHFGPWSSEAYQRIEPALLQIGAKARPFRSQYRDDAVRWSLQDDLSFRQVAHELPFQVTHAVQRYVHQFNADTENLLHFVYRTWPMLHAKPGELLDFTIPNYMKTESPPDEEHTVAEPQKLSVKQRKKREMVIKTAKEKLEGYLAKKRNKKRAAPNCLC